MKKVYISGRIKDYADFFAHFEQAQRQLELLGHEVVNPCHITAGENPTYEDYMREDLKALLDCQAIYMLQGWECSVGARCEHMVAAICGLEIVYEPAPTITA